MSLAQGAATGAFMAAGMSISSVAVLRKTDHFPKNRTLLYILAATTLVGSLLGAIVVPKVDIQAFKYILVTITIAALPLLFIKSAAQHLLIRRRKLGLTLTITLLVVGSIITSSAFSILFALTLMTFFRMSALEMTALRRLTSITQSVVLFVAFAVQGYAVWQHAVAAYCGGSIGSYIGTKYAVKKGETFATYALAIMSLIGVAAVLVI